MNEAKPKLLLDWATHEAAKYACENWHYSGCMPAGKTLKVGAWENGKYIGAIVFSGGPSPNIWKTYGLKPIEGSELSRVALTVHDSPVSRIVSISIKFLRKSCPGIKLIISYADLARGHHGGIYQAGNWFYLGPKGPKVARFLYGKQIHERNMRQRILDGKNSRNQFTEKPVPPKHKYAIAFDAGITARLKREARPYPKRAVSKEIVASPNHGEEGGETPTTALQFDTMSQDG